MTNTTTQSTDQCMPEWYDPYPEPNTMPRKWDLSQYGYTQNDAAKPVETEKQETTTA